MLEGYRFLILNGFNVYNFTFWGEREVNLKLRDIMDKSFNNVYEISQKGKSLEVRNMLFGKPGKGEVMKASLGIS